MKVRARQTTQVNVPQVGQPYDPNHSGGVLLVEGPTISDDGTILVPGKEATVPDDFVVNRDVWEVVEPPAKGSVRYWGDKQQADKTQTTGA